MTTEEIFTALKNFEYNEDEVTMLLTKNEFIGQLRNEIAQFRHKNPISSALASAAEVVQVPSYSDSEESYNSETESEIVDAKELKFEDKVQTVSTLKRKGNHVNSSVKKISRLRLDDALANASDMEGWSEARIRAYQSMKTNPNTYFYRFNAPGETQRNGPWSKEEDELFMKRLAEFGADGQWGIFSMAIPGRVGYQVRKKSLR